MTHKLAILGFAAILFFETNTYSTNQTSYNEWIKLETIERLLSRDSIKNVYEARVIEREIKSETVKWRASIIFSEYKNPSNSVDIASKLKNQELKYEVFESLVKNKNPLNAIRLICPLQKKYIGWGIDLLNQTGYKSKVRKLEECLIDK